MMAAIQEKTRKYDILRMLVAEYVETAEPVGSEAFCVRHRLSWSPATVRNDFMALEDEGYLAKPHTSGGRIPTNKAYRVIRDEVLEETDEEFLELWDPFAHAHIARPAHREQFDRYRRVSHMLAQLTRHVVLCGQVNGEIAEAGLSLLVREPEFAEQELVANVAEFLEMFTLGTRQTWNKFLANDVDVYIGEENIFPELKLCSLLIARFSVAGREEGFVALLGPTRMPYERNVAFAKHAADALGKRL